MQGDSAAGHLVRQMRDTGDRSFLPLGCFDTLSEGPLLPLDSLADFCRARAAHWTALGQDMSRIGGGTIHRALRSHLALAHRAERVEIWVGPDPRDQVFAAFVAALARQDGIPEERLFLLDLPEPPGFGLPPAAQTFADAISVEGHNALAQAWAALTAPDPLALAQFARTDRRLPRLSDGLRRLLHRFPSRRTGLGGVEEVLLRRISDDWRASARTVGEAMVDLFETDMIGDITLFNMLRRMAQPYRFRALVEFRGDAAFMQNCEIRLTPFGRSCRDGTANALEANGIDHWIAGSHLSSVEGRLWFREDLL